MKTLKDLAIELKAVADSAAEFNVNHTHIAKENGISYEYASIIRKGKQPKVDNDANRELVQGLISSYRKAIREKREKLNAIDVDL